MAYHGEYESPTELLQDGELSHRDKIVMLEQWRADEIDLMIASEEGMEGNDRPDLLKKIEKALIALRETSSDTE